MRRTHVLLDPRRSWFDRDMTNLKLVADAYMGLVDSLVPDSAYIGILLRTTDPLSPPTSGLGSATFPAGISELLQISSYLMAPPELDKLRALLRERLFLRLCEIERVEERIGQAKPGDLGHWDLDDSAALRFLTTSELESVIAFGRLLECDPTIEHSPAEMWLFGSLATGRRTIVSNIDLAVVCDGFSGVPWHKRLLHAKIETILASPQLKPLGITEREKAVGLFPGVLVTIRESARRLGTRG